MDATCTIQDSIHVFNLVHKYVSRILGTYHLCRGVYVFIDWVEPVIRHAFSSGLCSGVYRQPQWAYVGVFMYSLAGWRRFYDRKCVI